jgi:hypothetical protein
MPYISVQIGKKLTDAQKDSLAEKIGKLVEIIPGKFYEKTMVQIDDGRLIYRGGKATECLFMETRLFQENDLAGKTEFTNKLFELFDRELGIPNSQVYMNILELKHWASKGKLQ